MLSRDVILSVDDRKIERVAVPEWGGDVCVRVMSGAERDSFESQMLARKGGADVSIRAPLAAVTLCDEAGRRLFTPADVEALGEKSGTALDRVFNAAIRINAMGKADVEALEKNSGSAPSGASGSN